MNEIIIGYGNLLVTDQSVIFWRSLDHFFFFFFVAHLVLREGIIFLKAVKDVMDRDYIEGKRKYVLREDVDKGEGDFMEIMMA